MTNKNTITFTVSTKGRYFTTLPSCLLSIVTQTVVPDKLIIFDDNVEKIDLREVSIYKNIFALFEKKGIKWSVVFGEGKGQVLNHQKALEIVDTEWIFRCFRGREKVETSDGLKNIRDIKIGEYVKTHKNRFRKVIKTFKREYKNNKDLIWVKTAHSTIKCTPEHPFLVKRKQKIEWIDSNYIINGDCLLYPYKDKKDFLIFDCSHRGKRGSKQSVENYFGDLEVDTDLARFMGLYLAEGCGGHDSIRFTFNNNEKEYINFIQDICIKKFNRKPTIHRRWATTVKLNIRSFSDKFVEWFGKEATIKKIPEFVFKWNLKNKLSFIKGYLDGDGWFCSNNCLFYTGSKTLYEDLNKLLKSSGLDCSDVYIRKPAKYRIKGRVGISNFGYQGTISSDAYRKMLDLLESEIYNEYLLVPVKNIEFKKTACSLKDNNVYNLEVDEDNTYIVDSSIVHNCDDDCIYESDVIKNMLECIDNKWEQKIGAIAPLVLHPTHFTPLSDLASNKIEDIELGMNIQWFTFKGIKDVDHLYSTFMFRKEAGIHGYCKDLSPVGHNEETIFTYEMKRKGWNLLVQPRAVAWHLRDNSGGIRSYNNPELWQHDKNIFLSKLKEWGIKLNVPKIFVLVEGLGDHIVFRTLLPEIRNKYKDNQIIIAASYPEVFKEDKDIKIISIADAMAYYGNIEQFSVYRFMAVRNWKKELVEAYRELYLS